MPSSAITVTASFGLSEMEATFVRKYLSSGQKEASAAAAGYSSPNESAYFVLRLPHVAEALQYELGRLLRVEDAPRARRILLDLMEDTKAGARIQFDAAKTVLGLAGFVPPSKSAADEAPEKQLTEMSQEELRSEMQKREAEVDRLEAELAARATQVNAPNQTDTSQETSNLLD